MTQTTSWDDDEDVSLLVADDDESCLTVAWTTSTMLTLTTTTKTVRVVFLLPPFSMHWVGLLFSSTLLFLGSVSSVRVVRFLSLLLSPLLLCYSVCVMTLHRDQCGRRRVLSSSSIVVVVGVVIVVAVVVIVGVVGGVFVVFVVVVVVDVVVVVVSSVGDICSCVRIRISAPITG